MRTTLETRLDYVLGILELLPIVVREQGLNPMSLDLSFNRRELLQMRKDDLVRLYNDLSDGLNGQLSWGVKQSEA